MKRQTKLLLNNEIMDELNFYEMKGINIQEKTMNDQDFAFKVYNAGLDRRDFLKIFGGLFIVNSACSKQDVRSFLIQSQKVFKWLSALTYADLAFRLIDPHGKSPIDYLDFHCSTCKFAFRLFSFAIDIIDTAISIACPQCSVPAKSALVVSNLIVKKLLSYVFNSGIALLKGNNYQVHKIAPALFAGGSIGVGRSNMCYDISYREPVGYFNRKIPAIPRKIFYFTKLEGANRSTSVYHTWIKNGQITDKIQLRVDSNSFRTWSYKRNLSPGEWIVLTETKGGAVLNVKEFSILG